MNQITNFISILFIFLFCKPETRIADSVQVGMPKGEIRQLLDKPDVIDSIQKNTEIIWGAEEAFWDELPIGTTLEIWIYEKEENEFRFYFIDGGDTISYKIVAPKEAVYESVD